MSDHLQTFRAALGRTRSGRTVATYTRVAAEFSASLTGAPTQGDVEGFLARTRRDGQPRAPATHNQELAALRSLARFALREGWWATDPTADIHFVREPPRHPSVLSPAELRKLFEAAGQVTSDVWRSRNLAILAVLSQAALRVHELIALDIDQVDLVSRTLLDVRGKGGTRADVPLNAEAAALLTAWLDRRFAVTPEGESALFVSLRGTRLSIRSVERLLFQLRSRTGTRKRITPHTLRHSAATIALVLGADLSTVGDLLRHADLNTTRRYLHLVDERKREAVRRLGSTVPSSVLPEPRRAVSRVRDEPTSQSASTMHSGVDDQYPLNEVPEGRSGPPEAPNSSEFEASTPPDWRAAA